MAAVTFVAGLLTLSLRVVAVDHSEAIYDALDADDHCVLGTDCALNALQLRGAALPVELPVELLALDASEEELTEWHNKWYGRTPGMDISVTNYKSMMHNISAQQKAILGIWNESGVLEKEVDALVQQVQHDSGLKVADYVALVEDGEMTSREQAEGNQPREAHVRKWLAYMDQEMSAVFRKLNSNGQKTAAAGTLMSKNPVPLKLKSSLAQSANVTLPGDHVGKADELWRSILNLISNIHTANMSATNLKDHIGKINVMIVDFNEGKLIPEGWGK